MNRGKFITFEGPEGVGKTTQVALIGQELQRRHIPYIAIREPGGTEIGNRVRDILLDPELQMMTTRAEMLLFAASRAQLVDEVIQPALQTGKIVLCDRYVDSTIAYQVFGAGADRDEVMQVNQVATAGCMPDRTYLLDLSVSASRGRLASRGKHLDRQEAKHDAFHQRVRDGYLQLASENEARYLRIEADHPSEKVFSNIWGDLSSYVL